MNTTTNKLPLLMDRPYCRVLRLDGTSTVGSIDPGTGTNAVLLLDCTQNDGALVENIWLLQRFADDVTRVNLYLSTSNVSLGVTASGGQADSFFMGTAEMPINAEIGNTVDFRLPRVLAPVAHASASGNPEVPQLRGLRVEKGYCLWAACDGPGPHPNAPNIGIMGGLH